MACAVGILMVVCASAGAATLRVTTTADGFATHGGQCTLREAIAAVDSPGLRTPCGSAGSGSNTIMLGTGRYRLSIPPQGVDDNSTGDLNVTSSARLEIIGRGRSATIISAKGLGDRVLSVSGTGAATLQRLTITGGQAGSGTPGPPGAQNVGCIDGGSGGDGVAGTGGGGIYNSGQLSLNAVSVRGNAAGAGGAGGAGGIDGGTTGCRGGSGGQGGDGGGIVNWGLLNLVDSTIKSNRAGTGGAGGSGGVATGGLGGSGGQGGGGGGVSNHGALLVRASAIYGNRAGAGGDGAGGGGASGEDGAGGAGGPGGGILSADGTLSVTNSTLTRNRAGDGGAGGALTGMAGNGGSGGAIQVTNGLSTVLNATIANNSVGSGGPSQSQAGAGGSGGGISVYALQPQDDMRLKNTIVASNAGSQCAVNRPTAIGHGGYNLSFGDRTCPGKHADPRLGSLRYNGGPTKTMALASGSSAIGRVPRHGAGCPASDQRGVSRAQSSGCDAGAFEFAVPVIRIISPRPGGSYERGSRVRVRFRCSEGGIPSLITACRATIPEGHLIRTRATGSRRITVTAVDRSGRRTRRSARYSIWAYVNPMKAIRGLQAQRVDMGVDYGGSGPLLALGDGTVLGARNNDDGSVGCWAFCWPGGGIVVYRLTDGPFAGKYVFVAEHITVSVRAGEKVRAGQRVAVLHAGSPNMETGWASGNRGQPLSIARHDQCPCGDPGGWSTIEGRNFNQLLVRLGARSGRLQPNPPQQSMPAGWPTWR